MWTCHPSAEHRHISRPASREMRNSVSTNTVETDRGIHHRQPLSSTQVSTPEWMPEAHAHTHADTHAGMHAHTTHTHHTLKKKKKQVTTLSTNWVELPLSWYSVPSSPPSPPPVKHSLPDTLIHCPQWHLQFRDQLYYISLKAGPLSRFLTLPTSFIFSSLYFLFN